MNLFKNFKNKEINHLIKMIINKKYKINNNN